MMHEGQFMDMSDKSISNDTLSLHRGFGMGFWILILVFIVISVIYFRNLTRKN